MRFQGSCRGRRILHQWGLFLVCVLASQGTSHLYSQTAEIKQPEKAIVYTLSPFDVLGISVYGQSELSSRQRITDQGSVSIPLIGEISVGGLSVSEAQRRIERRFIEMEYLVKPVVTINIEEFSPKFITVLGEVGSPGSIEIPTGSNSLPIQMVIAGAGGFKGAANRSSVKVTRAQDSESDQTAPGEIVNVAAILDANGSKESKRTYDVFAGDIVFVPRRLF